MRFLLLVLPLCAAAASAALIDSIAITVGNQAITQTEITRDIRLSSLLNGDSPDYGAESRKKAADRLVEQALIRKEMTFGNYPPIPPAQVEEAVAATEKARGGSTSVRTQLQQYNLTESDLRDYLEWQLGLLKFIDLRFRPAVQVTSDDVDKYYRENVQAQPGPDGKPPSLSALHDKIQQKLVGERVDRQVDDWLKRARTRAALRYLDKTLGTTGAAPLEQTTH